VGPIIKVRNRLTGAADNEKKNGEKAGNPNRGAIKRRWGGEPKRKRPRTLAGSQNQKEKKIGGFRATNSRKIKNKFGRGEGKQPGENRKGQVTGKHLTLKTRGQSVGQRPLLGGRRNRLPVTPFLKTSRKKKKKKKKMFSRPECIQVGNPRKKNARKKGSKPPIRLSTWGRAVTAVSPHQGEGDRVKGKKLHRQGELGSRRRGKRKTTAKGSGNRRDRKKKTKTTRGFRKESTKKGSNLEKKATKGTRGASCPEKVSSHQGKKKRCGRKGPQ